MHYQLANGRIYPPHVPCLRGRCPEDDRWREGPPRLRQIVIGCAIRPEEGPAPGREVDVDQFRSWDPETNRPRLQVIVWRDSNTGLLRYHGPPRWYEIDGIEEPRLVPGVGVTESMEEIVEELRRTDETLSLSAINSAAGTTQS